LTAEQRKVFPLKIYGEKGAGHGKENILKRFFSLFFSIKGITL
jgi:hypothetical protein